MSDTLMTTHGLSFLPHISSLFSTDFASQLTPSTIFHFRVLNAFRFTIKTLRPRVRPRPSMVFQPIITSSSADLGEMDFDLHKTNSSYFADADTARVHLMSTLFDPAIERMRGDSGAYTGAVSCSFRREIHLDSAFDMWTHILAWDDKGRKTTSPADMIRMAGLVPDDGEVSSSDELDEATTDGEVREVEEQRRGEMKLTAILTKENQLALDAEFYDGEGEVLGRHSDGTGVAGVVLTLLQLAGLKKKWYLWIRCFCAW
ncbi:hypothetical protein CTA2_5402 [Colletotrichum tanaceti]|uniref:Thioesterase domain-containing protein n=1 Tax=Colletotrichum tanaceti TaxID=1306861 RepID=A0A4U6XUT7_9PEZI|nr:hypothetical protein CTA2_5402 [Colletotrichum tanaceti]TKW59691.1 hypothetical protein CTA1_10399 [Colletotrichum tanaceti]